MAKNSKKNATPVIEGRVDIKVMQKLVKPLLKSGWTFAQLGEELGCAPALPYKWANLKQLKTGSEKHHSMLVKLQGKSAPGSDDETTPPKGGTPLASDASAPAATTVAAPVAVAAPARRLIIREVEAAAEALSARIERDVETHRVTLTKKAIAQLEMFGATVLQMDTAIKADIGGSDERKGPQSAPVAAKAKASKKVAK